MLDCELWKGHLWLHIQWVATMVIVTLLKKSVVCCLPTNWHISRHSFIIHNRSESLFRLAVLPPRPHLRETALVIQNPQYPMRLSSDEVDAGLVVVKDDVLPRDLLPAVLLLQEDHVYVIIYGMPLICVHVLQIYVFCVFICDMRSVCACVCCKRKCDVDSPVPL